MSFRLLPATMRGVRHFSTVRDKLAKTFAQFAANQKRLGLKSGCISTATDDKPESVTLLLGWLGSKTKTLAKYAEVHQSVYNTACCCVNPTVIDAHLLKPAQAKMKKLFQAAVEANFEEKVPLILHNSSGGSNIFLYSLLPMLASEESPFELKGIVFDSGPTEFVRDTGMAAAKLLKEQKVYTGLPYYARLYGALLAHSLFGSSRRAERQEILRNELLTSVPHLYLYSREDPVFPHHQAQRVIEMQIERGVDVFQHAWNDRSHVRLLATHPEEYKQHLSEFVRYCLHGKQSVESEELESETPLECEQQQRRAAQGSI